MKKVYNKLEWDSDFFGFSVGKISGEVSDVHDLQEIEELMLQNRCELAYFSTQQEVPSFVFQSENLEFTFVDRKITYSKSIDTSLEISESVSAVSGMRANEKLIELAIQSGEFSRFKVDKRIDSGKFEEMFGLWMIKSLNGDLASEVLVFTSKNQVAGVVTIGEKNSKADIGLIAVDGLFRGKGIGKTLMTSAEKWCSNAGFQSIQVVTQGDNVPARKLYESCGYSIESVEMIYHIWKR